MENVNKLEYEYAKFVSTKYAVAVNSGTAALHLSLVALGIGRDDEVIVPDFTMAAVGFAVAYTGAKVVTVDCGDDYNINVNLIHEKITPKTKAIIAVDTYGRLCDIKTIRKIAKAKGLFVIQDSCEAQGSSKGGDSDCLVFSFFKNKIIHGEEGGIVCTDSKEIADNIRDLKNMAFGSKHNYFHERIGFNYRMPDSQAKMILKSLEQFYQNWTNRIQFETIWNKLIPTQKRDAVWVYDFLCKSKEDKDIKIKELNDNKIKWRHFFKPLSTMPMFLQPVGLKAFDFSNRGLYIQYNE